MPFNGSGTFVRLENWSNDAANNLPISATKFDIEDNDFAGAFDLCLTRDGQGKPSTALVWNQTLTLSPTSGVGLTINGVASQIAAQINSGNTTAVTDLYIQRSGGVGTANTLLAGANLQLLNLGSGNPGTVIQNSGGQTEIWQENSGAWAQLAYWSNVRGLILNAPASGVGLLSSGTIAGNTVGGVDFQLSAGSAIRSASTTGGMFIDFAAGGGLSFRDNSAFSIRMAVNVGSITGLGPVSNSQVDMTPDKGSWTSTLSGPYSSNPSGTIKWERQGTQVTVWCDANITGTASNNTTISCSGLPAAITPSSTRQVACVGLESGSSTGVCGLLGSAQITSGGTIIIGLAEPISTGVTPIQTGNFQNSGTCGLLAGWSITYSL